MKDYIIKLLVTDIIQKEYTIDIYNMIPLGEKIISVKFSGTKLKIRTEREDL